MREDLLSQIARLHEQTYEIEERIAELTAQLSGMTIRITNTGVKIDA